MNSYVGDGALQRAREFLKEKADQVAADHVDIIGNASACDRIMVENQTKFDLEYVTHNYRSGWPQDDVKKSFVLKEDYDYVLPPGAVGTQLWRFHQGGNFYKTWGAILTTPGKDYIVCCGSTIGNSRCNKAGIQIRGEDGVLDGVGNVSGHGVDPTGVVSDINGLVMAVDHATPGAGAIHQFKEVTRSFEVICRFNNEFRGEHHFIFKDAKEEGAGSGDCEKNQSIEEAFAKYDADGDGALSFDEFKKMMDKKQ